MCDNCFVLVTKFKSPDDFFSLLNSQKYGPTTQLIASDVRGMHHNMLLYLSSTLYIIIWYRSKGQN